MSKFGSTNRANTRHEHIFVEVQWKQVRPFKGAKPYKGLTGRVCIQCRVSEQLKVKFSGLNV